MNHKVLFWLNINLNINCIHIKWNGFWFRIYYYIHLIWLVFYYHSLILSIENLFKVLTFICVCFIHWDSKSFLYSFNVLTWHLLWFNFTLTKHWLLIHFSLVTLNTHLQSSFASTIFMISLLTFYLEKQWLI